MEYVSNETSINKPVENQNAAGSVKQHLGEMFDSRGDDYFEISVEALNDPTLHAMLNIINSRIDPIQHCE